MYVHALDKSNNVHVYDLIYFYFVYTPLESKSMVISKEGFQSFKNNVGNAFIALQTKMRELLKSANCNNLENACIAQQHNPRGVELSQKLIKEISTRESSEKLFDLLVNSPYWSWIEIRLLEALVIASENPQACELLDNYKAVVFSKRLFDLLPNVPKKKVKEKDYSKIKAKLNKDCNVITVADLLEFQSHLEDVIMDIKKGKCIIKHLKKGCMEIHWYIPTSCIKRAYWNARVKHYKFVELHLQYLKIGHNPVIHNPSIKTDVVSAQSYLGNVKNTVI